MNHRQEMLRRMAVCAETQARHPLPAGNPKLIDTNALVVGPVDEMEFYRGNTFMVSMRLQPIYALDFYREEL